MTLRKTTWATMACVLLLALTGRAMAGEEDVLGLLRVMPADLPLTVVVADFEKLDKAIAAAAKRIAPDEAGPTMLADLKGELPFAEWVNFSKPMGIGMPASGGPSTPEGSSNEPMMWVNVPDFATKVKSVDGATQEEGVWKLPFEGGTTTLYVKVKGDYAIVSPNKEPLAKATTDGKSVADDMKSRLDVLRGRDVLIHVNVDPVRPMALSSIAQASQMIPMFMMMAAQGGTVDPAALTAMATGGIDAVKCLVEQTAYVDVFIGLNDQAANATILTGYKDGPIKDYLSKQKPAGVPLLADLEDQPYAIAGGSQIPGNESPFIDYLFDKITAALPQPQPPPEGGTAPQTDTVKQGLKAARELYRLMEGGNMVVSLSPEGVRTTGNYFAKDPKTLLGLLKQSITSANPLTEQFSPGVKYEALGERKIGDVGVEEFALKIDESNPAAAAVREMYGENPKMAAGVVGGRVRFSMGSEAQINRAFGSKIEKPLSSNKYVSEAAAALPEKRNVLLLIDPVGVIGMLPAQMTGLPKTEPAPPGPPIAISASLAGEPARIDIHVPLRAIERVKQTVAPSEGT